MLTRFSTRPVSPARPVRPMRWMCTSASGVTSTLITAARLAMSSPRAATSVATSTEQLRLAKRTSTWSRSRCSSSPYSASALKPCACSASTSFLHCALVLQKASALAGRKWLSSRLTAPHALAVLHLVPALLDLPARVLRLDLHCHRLAHELRREFRDAFRVGGGEQQRLARLRALARHRDDVVEEAHVQHAVGFVQHQRVERVELQAFARQVVHHAARRAHHDVRAVLQRRELAAQRHAAAQRHDLDVVLGTRQPADLGRHLVGQLARRAQHQRLHREAARVQVGQQRQRESRRLAAAGLGLRDDVLAQQRRGRLAAWIGVIVR